MNIGEGVNKNSKANESRLVLSIDQKGKIVFFNKECEKIAGYAKNEALDRKVLDFLIPKRHRERWGEILDEVIQEQSTNNFELPWLTKNGKEVMASWAVAHVGGSEDGIGDIGLVGRIIPIVDDIALSDSEEASQMDFDDSEDIFDNTLMEKKDDTVLFTFKGKRVVFRKKSSSKSKVESDKSKTEDSSKESEFIPDQTEDVTNSEEEDVSKDTLVADEEIEESKKEEPKDFDNLLKKYSHNNLEKNFENYNKTVKSLKVLEDKVKELEDENIELKKSLKTAKANFTRTKHRLEALEKDQDGLAEKTMESFRGPVDFVFDVVGGKKKKEEFDSMIHELDERRTALSDVESQLNMDKKEINENRNEFIKWREKLEILEEEINRREEAIVLKEEKVKKNLTFFMESDTVEGAEIKKDELSSVSGEMDSNADVEHHSLLDKIPQSAAIIQRGILKQVNDSFVDLLGYDVNSLVERNLFDFVVPEGFSGVEKYYLKRLKGESVSSYETMFNTGKDSRITVEVSTKPVSFNGEKAEIAVFKRLDGVQEDTNTIQPTDDVTTGQEIVKDIKWGGKSQSEINEIINVMKEKTKEDLSAIGEIEVKSEESVTLDDSEKINSDEPTVISDEVKPVVAEGEPADVKSEEIATPPAVSEEVSSDDIKLDEPTVEPVEVKSEEVVTPIVTEEAEFEEVSSDESSIDTPSAEETSQAEIDAMIAKASEKPSATPGDKVPVSTEETKNEDLKTEEDTSKDNAEKKLKEKKDVE